MTDEKQTSENQNQEQSNSDGNSQAGLQSETIDPIERAIETAKRLEAVEKRLDEKTKELGRILSHDILAGKSRLSPPPRTEAEEAAEIAERTVTKYFPKRD